MGKWENIELDFSKLGWEGGVKIFILDTKIANIYWNTIKKLMSCVNNDEYGSHILKK